jgi:ankyrin repeat protein
VVQRLLEIGIADFELTGGKSQTAFSFAASKGHVEIVKMLLKTGKVDFDCENTLFGQTALTYAAKYGQEEIVKVLLATGKVNVEIKPRVDGRTPLAWAVAEGHERVVKILLETGKANAKSKDGEGRTPLDLAEGAPKRNAAIIQLLKSFTS